MLSMFPHLYSGEAWLMFFEGIAILLVSGLLIFMVFSHIFKKRVKLIFAIMDFSISVFAVVLVFNFFLM